MESFKKILKALLYPHVALIVLLVPVSVAFLLCGMLILGETHVLSYVAYVLSAYTLTVICFRIPALIAFINRIKEENAFLKRLTTDAHFRVKISLHSAFYFNLAFALFQLITAIMNTSVMFYSFAIYYFLLALMRMYLLGYTRSNSPGENMLKEYKRYRFCGIAMLILNIALSVMVTYIILFDKPKNYGMIVTIAMAFFTFMALTVAIVNVVKYSKYNSPVFNAAKNISLAVAVVSMLTLEASMFAAFANGEMSENDMLIMMATTGFAVMVFVLGLAIMMITRGSKKIKEFNQEENS